jgi:LysM repeat protein
MRFKHFSVSLFLSIALVVFGVGAIHSPQVAQAAPLNQASAYDLILAMNTLRVSYGLPALVEDSIVDAVAQSTAATMAANNMSWHIGDVRGRLAAAGYGGGATVWATENFAMYSGGTGVDQIMAMWSDADHMRPAVEAAYCNVGAGIAKASNGRIYYVLQAAYVDGQACGSSSSTSSSSGTVVQSGTASSPVSQSIMPVKIATPDAEGKIYHTVQAGQSYWAIAIAYQITIQDIETWNNISRDTSLQAGQKLFIPGKDTKGYATPTPFGMIVPAAADKDGRIVHEVAPYQALSTIADAYHVSVERILTLNGLQADGTLQIGQKLLIDPGNITPSPALSAIQMLTPEADGNYYHTVQSGETLSWIAGQYDVSLADLMNWNGLNNTSVIRPEQKLLLRVTPPATATRVPSPTMAPHTPSPSVTPPAGMESPTSAASASPSSGGTSLGLILGVIMIAAGGGLFFWWKFGRKSLDG